ncbi:MAG TPA: hypothetical protein DCQ98_16330 [Planctomycetaceae bacterium]|nr:hypothetical protein [Planctomycetaceae bacterium]
MGHDNREISERGPPGEKGSTGPIRALKETSLGRDHDPEAQRKGSCRERGSEGATGSLASGERTGRGSLAPRRRGD